MKREMISRFRFAARAEARRVIGPFGDVPLRDWACKDDVNCRHVRTYRHLNQATHRPLQLDFVFGTKGVRDNVISCNVLDGERYWSVSDHAPIRVVLGP